MARRLVVIAVVVAVCGGGSLLGAGVASSAGATSAAGARGSHAVKQTKAARCAKLRRAAKQPLAAKRRAAVRRARKLGCSLAPAKRPKPGKPAVLPAPAATTSPAISTPSGPAPAGPAGPGIVEPPPPPAPPQPPPPPPASTLGVGAYDMDGFLLRLTRTSVPAGELTVFFRNYDVSDHNLWMASPGGGVVEQISDTVGEGGGGSRTLPVSAGAWRLFCSLPDHGVMTRTLTVTP